MLGELGAVAALASSLGVRFVYALHPAVSMRFADDVEHARLVAKTRQLASVGIREFALLFDDVPPALSDPADVARFGAGGSGLGAAHGYAVTRFAAAVGAPAFVCPTDYAGIEASPYRDALARSAPDKVPLAWTGAGVVVAAVTRAEIDRAAESYQRPLVLWDNFPVNDFDPSRLFLGPLTGRPSDLAGSALIGVLANPMIEAVPSRIPLATVAEWAHAPGAYDAVAAAARAVSRAGAGSLAPLIRACSGWPPSADQDPELTRACAAALESEPKSMDYVDARLSELAECCRSPAAPAALVDELAPWLAGAEAMAAAGLLAVRLLRATTDDRSVRNLREAARAGLTRAESHYATVLRPIVAPFVRAALLRADRTR